MKIFIILWFLFSFPLDIEAQQPILTVDFENEKGLNNVNGIIGKAFDLGPLSSKRYALAVDNPLTESGENFSVTVWVKSPKHSDQYYNILSSLKPDGEEYYGWKIAVQPNGAWKFGVKTEKNEYEYVPTAPRQTIRDGKWHLLAFAYQASKNELRFYYDGKLMAIYNAPGIDGFYSGKKLVIGNSLDSKYERVTGEITEPHYVKTEWDSFYGWIDDVHIYAETLNVQEISSYYSRLTGIERIESFDFMPDLFKVTTFNIWHGGNRLGMEAGKNRLIEMLKRTCSDVFLLIETYGSGEEIADALGYYLYLISSNLSIISRYPITETYKVFKPFHSGGARIRLPGGKELNLFCVWLSSQPQYYIEGLNEEDSWPLKQYMKEENKTRGAEMRAFLDEIKQHLKGADSIPLVVGGDFNSGSHLDWNEETTSIHHGYVVPWPASIAAENVDLRDSFRELHPDPLKSLGITWSPTRDFPLKDRIDYIYYKGKHIQAISSEVIKQHPVAFPSDHAGVSTLFQLKW